MNVEVAPRRSRWQRVLWLAAGAFALVLGLVGVFLPLVPTTPFVLLAAFCFSRGSVRCEQWLLNHPRFGPLVHNWRTYRAIPLPAKRLAYLMMTIGSLWAWWSLPAHVGWLPAACCLAVGVWMWRLPNTLPAGGTPSR